ncbi:16342_t:CDS:1, partial [Rhizophagus irregularis]
KFPLKYPIMLAKSILCVESAHMMRDIDPMSIKSWVSNRIVLLGDMSPILGLGANNAIQDADKLSQALLKYMDSNISFIEEYEKKC